MSQCDVLLVLMFSFFTENPTCWNRIIVERIVHRWYTITFALYCPHFHVNLRKWHTVYTNFSTSFIFITDSHTSINNPYSTCFRLKQPVFQFHITYTISCQFSQSFLIHSLHPNYYKLNYLHPKTTNIQALFTSKLSKA